MAKKIPEPGKSPATVQILHLGMRTYELKYVYCGKKNCGKCNRASGRYPSHGPYWYLCFFQNGKWHRIYLGKNLDTRKFICADGSINWQQLQERRRKKHQAKPDRESAPDRVDVEDLQAADSGPSRARGPGHIAMLEDQSQTTRAND